MSFNITVEGGKSVRLPTAGKYCDRDIVVTAEGGSSALVLTMANPTKSVTLSQIDKLDIVCENATTIGDSAFSGCDSLTSINLPVATTIGSGAFNDCTALASIDLPVAEMIDVEAFYKCTSLPSIDLPVAKTIGFQAFRYCTLLTSVDLPIVTTISEYAFADCTALASVDLPSATSIRDGAFLLCSALDTLILRSNTLCDINITAALGTNIVSAEGMPTGQGFIYVPTALYESYIANLVPKVIAFATLFGMPIDEATATYMVTMILRKIEDYPDICGG